MFCKKIYVCLNFFILPGKQLGPTRPRNGIKGRVFNWRHIVIIMEALIVIWHYCPVVLTSGLLILRLDPFTYSLPILLSPAEKLFVETKFYSVYNFFLSLFRIVLSFICVFEAGRFMAFYFTLLLYHMEVTLKTISLVSLNLGKQKYNRLSRFFTEYSILTLTRSSILGSCLDEITAVTMGVGFVALIIVNLFTIRCYNILPIIIYWLMPSTSVAGLFLIYFLLNLEVTICKRSTLVICNARVAYNDILQSSFLKSGLDARYLDRKFCALRPLHAKCGIFYRLKGGSELDYFLHLFNRTVDGILLPIW